MTFRELSQNWDDLKTKAKREKLSKVLLELNALIHRVDGDDDLDGIFWAISGLVDEIEANDGFGTEGMKI